MGEKYEITIHNRDDLLRKSYTTEQEAKDAIMNFRIRKIERCIESNKLCNCKFTLYKDHYLVFDSGVISNLHGKIMVGCIDRCGYHEVIINSKMERVHRIIAECFIPNPSNLPCVNHLDGIKTNNDVKNLEWISYSDNTKHAYDTGLEKKMVGEQHHNAKLTWEDVDYIRKNYIHRDKQFGIAALARKFNLSPKTVRSVVMHETWRKQ